MEHDFNEYNYDMVPVHVHVLNTNLCEEVTGVYFIFFCGLIDIY